MKMLAAALMLATSAPRDLPAQQAGNDSAAVFLPYFTFHDDAPLSCLLTYFPPFFIQHGMEMKSFLRSKVFHRLRERLGDLRALDALFVRSMQLTNNNTGVALLLTTIATFDHRVVGLKIPVLQFALPLSDESQQEFDGRVAALPNRIYADTPPGAAGDRDKLQHFFGSAFLTLAFESESGADRTGTFVEEGEDLFIVGGVNDERDLRADRDGRRFGQALMADNHLMPSRFLSMQRDTAWIHQGAAPGPEGGRR